MKIEGNAIGPLEEKIEDDAVGPLKEEIEDDAIGGSFSSFPVTNKIGLVKIQFLLKNELVGRFFCGFANSCIHTILCKG